MTVDQFVAFLKSKNQERAAYLVAKHPDVVEPFMGKISERLIEKGLIVVDVKEPEPATLTVEVPLHNVDTFEERISALKKKGDKLGVTFTVTRGDTFVKQIEHVDDIGRKKTYNIPAVTFTVTTEPIRLKGWSFVATIEHQHDKKYGNVNIVKQAPNLRDYPLPLRFRTDAPTCDYCQTNRDRKETFVLYKTGEGLKRVGRNCLKDFIGDVTALKALRGLEFLDGLKDDLERGFDDGGSSFSGPRYYAIDRVLTRAAQAVRIAGGYKPRNFDRPTVNDVWMALNPPKGKQATPWLPQDVEAAKAVEAWVRSIPLTERDPYLYNLRATFLGDSVPWSAIGMVVSAIAGYLKARGDAVFKKKGESTRADAYFGVVGQRFGGGKKSDPPAFDSVLLKKRPYESPFGKGHFLMGRRIPGGEAWVSFHGGRLPADLEEGSTIRVSGSVKAQEPDKKTGEKTTILNRCDFTVLEAAPEVVHESILEDA